jgi:hypothetical protein
VSLAEALRAAPRNLAAAARGVFNR